MGKRCPQYEECLITKCPHWDEHAEDACCKNSCGLHPGSTKCSDVPFKKPLANKHPDKIGVLVRMEKGGLHSVYATVPNVAIKIISMGDGKARPSMENDWANTTRQYPFKIS